jgi:hypothetical protein
MVEAVSTGHAPIEDEDDFDIDDMEFDDEVLERLDAAEKAAMDIDDLRLPTQVIGMQQTSSNGNHSGSSSTLSRSSSAPRGTPSTRQRSAAQDVISIESDDDKENKPYQEQSRRVRRRIESQYDMVGGVIEILD